MTILPVILAPIITGRVDIVLVLATCPDCFVESIVHLRSALLGPSSLHILLDDTLEGADTHSTLAVSSQCIVSGKGVSTKTWVRLGAGVNLGMPLEVMTTNEAFLAMIAPKLAIP